MLITRSARVHLGEDGYVDIDRSLCFGKPHEWVGLLQGDVSHLGYIMRGKQGVRAICRRCKGATERIKPGSIMMDEIESRQLFSNEIAKQRVRAKKQATQRKKALAKLTKNERKLLDI